MKFPHLADTLGTRINADDTFCSRVGADLDRMTREIHARFPGVLAHVGSMSDGSGSGFKTLIIQGEYVPQAQKMFPDVLVTAMSETDYMHTKEQQARFDRHAA